MNLSFALATVLACVPVLGCASEPPAAERTLATLDRQVPAWMEQARVPAVAIAVIRDGAVAGTRVYGERAPGVPADDRTVFNVASLTKPVFSMMALRLVADGQLELDEPLHSYWTDPDVADDARRLRLTPRVLMSHQAGFQNWRGDDRLAFSFAPGEKHQYSGEGFEYLRRALEKKASQSMPALMRQYVLAPAGMEASFGWNERVAGNVATGFDEAGKPLGTQHLRQRGANAAASMFATVSEYGRFVAWVADADTLPGALSAEAARPQALHDDPAETFGLGWKLVRRDDATVALWHDGREAGVRTLALLRPAERDGLVVLTNSSNGELVMRRVLEAALPQGEVVTRQMDRDVWRYLASLPGPELGKLLGAIVGSPSYMSTMLHAVDTNLVQASALAPEHKRAAAEAIDAFALAMLHGRVDRSQAEALLTIALRIEGNTPMLRDELTIEQARSWTDQLVAAASQPATAVTDETLPATDRPTVKVAKDVLARYAGRYLVPSTQLTITIVVDGDTLLATAPGTPATTFHAESETLFFMKESATDFEFQLGEGGAVTGIRIIWDGKRSELAARVP